jgi:hypothetical protein
MEDGLNEVVATQAVVMQAIRVPDRPSTGSMSEERIPGTTKIVRANVGKAVGKIWGSQVENVDRDSWDRGLESEGLLVPLLYLVRRRIDDAGCSCNGHGVDFLSATIGSGRWN